ncbi:hypothetical protein Tco_0617077 [Tanacetum coccineum]
MKGLEAYDGKVNLAFDENLISNESAVKLCLDYEVKKGKKLAKKEFIVALKGELYSVKFIINPKENDFEPGVVLGRSFLRLAQGVVDFGNGVIAIYPEPDLFEEEFEKTGKSSDDWDQLLDFNFDDVPKSGEELPPFVSGRHLTQEEAEKEELAIRISQRYALLEEERPVELDGRTVKEDEEAVKKIKGEALKEKDNPGAFIFPMQQEGKFDVLRTAKSDSDDEEEYVIKRNMFGAPIYGPRPAPYLNCTNPEDRSSAIQTTSGTHDGEAGSSRSKRPRQHKTVEELLLPQVHHEFLLWDGCSREAKSRYNTKLAQLLPRHIYSPCVVNWDVLNRVGCDGEIDDMLRISQRRSSSLDLVDVPTEGSDDNFNAQDYWLSISQEDNLGLSRSHTSTIRKPILRTSKWICECSFDDCKMDEEERSWDSEIESNLLWTIYDKIGYQGVFEHMVGVYSVPLQGAYNLPGYAQPQYDQYYQQYPPPPPQY